MGRLEADWLAGCWLGVGWGEVGDWVICLSCFISLAWSCSPSAAGFSEQVEADKIPYGLGK